MKIFEGCSIAVAIYANGHIRQSTGSYFGVSVLLIANASIGALAALYLARLASLPKEEEEEQAEACRDYERVASADSADIAKRYAKIKKEDGEIIEENSYQETELAGADKKGQLVETYAGVMEVQDDDEDEDETSALSSSAGTRKRPNKKMAYVQ